MGDIITDRQRFHASGILLLVCLSLLFSPVGCTTAERRAGQYSDRIAAGMGQEAVREALGAPDRVVRSPDGDAWDYSYGPRPAPARIALASAQIVGVAVIVGMQVGCIVALLALSRGSGGGGDLPFTFWTPGWTFPDVQVESVHFRVVFDRQGKVAFISGIEAGGIGP